MIYVIKKDGTREEFDPQKIVKAVNKSAARILYTFSDEENLQSARPYSLATEDKGCARCGT